MLKCISSPEDLCAWQASPAHSEILAFVKELQDSVVGLTNDAKVEVSHNVAQIVDILNQLEQLVAEHEVVHEKDVSRFGKAEFRDWYDDVEKTVPSLLQPLSSEPELGEYLVESFGNRLRIDYGSGHELNFVCFLLGLQKLGVLKKTDHAALVLRVFIRYIALMRVLQRTYWLEPAGSHGVWGLDDYHFLPFLFGAAQLLTHPHMKPKLIHNRELVDEYWTQYMYLECIHFVNSVKTTSSIRWHLPMLDDILLARLWAKIKEGMLKMYEAEVLGKLPIVQHVMFGRLLEKPDGVEALEGQGHVHTWGDCCGIKVPSAIAAVPYD